MKNIDADALVAQRLKRSPSIISKLRRSQDMNLARMQDIAGLRAVVEDIEKVRLLESSYLKSQFKHEKVGHRDYIECPKPTGYRGVHLIYKYCNSNVPEYDGLRLEIQIRTKLQHIWATAVETMGTFLSQALKSSEGPDEWLDFFALIGSAFAHIEECPVAPECKDLSKKEIFESVLDQASKLKVIDKLQAFRAVSSHAQTENQTGSYYLILLDVKTQQVSFESFGTRRLEEANEKYTNLERQVLDNNDLQVVLVAATSLDSLRRAYPNYFLDTDEFIAKIGLIREELKDMPS